MALRRASAFLKISIICAAVTAVAFGLLPLCDIFGNPRERVLAIITASTFWLSVILGQVFFWTANSRRKAIEKRAFKGKKLPRPTTGIKTFFSNTEAKIFDSALIISTILWAILLVADVQLLWLQHFSFTTMLLSFYLHCIFNGRTYRYIKAFHKFKKGANRNENSKKTYE